MTLKTPHLRCERLCDFGLVVRPVAPAADGASLPTLPAGKDIALTLMGITHGNEFAGAAVLNEILEHLVARSITLEVPVAFILGNPWAARENKRFLERDLNRSFNRQSQATKEERRALELTPILKRSAYLVDYHQTSRESDRAFFIFPYAAASFAFARAIAPRLTVVTHWGKPFSAEGMCTDEYVNSQGGTGVSVEVGQNGLDPYQIAVGVDAGLWAVRTVTDVLKGRSMADCAARGAALEPEIYTWNEILPWPETGYVELLPDWRNFRDVAPGAALGTVDGRPLTAGKGGKMLFPKYLTRPQQDALESRPTELCRLMRRIGLADLPTT